MKNLLSVLLILLAFNALGQVNKFDNWESAHQKAIAENKDILIILTGDKWYKPCIKMKKNVINHPDFIEFANANLVVFEINLTLPLNTKEEPYPTYFAFTKKYNTSALPSLILTDKDGIEKIKITNDTSSLDNILRKLTGLV